MKILVPALLILAGLAGLVTMGILQGGVPELQVHQVLAGAYAGQEVKMHGIIETIHSEERPLRFTIADKDDDAKRIDVVCDRTRPDTFQETYDVAVQGVFQPERGVFDADQIFTKCPSKYEAAEELGAGSPAAMVDPPSPASTTPPSVAHASPSPGPSE